MLSWVAKRYFSFVLWRLRAGDPRPALWLDHPDVEFIFPGDSSWSGTVRGKREHRAWLERFCRAGIQIFADEVVLHGWPWRQTVCVRGHDYCDAPTGERVYANRFVLWGELRWGRLARYEGYEDTKAVDAFDRWLAEHERREAA